MGMRWRYGSAASLEAFPGKILAKFEAECYAAMGEVIAQAVYDMRRFTETRPSAKSGKQGRVDTGAMLESIAGETFWSGVDNIVGRFGFLDRQELYFWLQTTNGFRHGASFIEPTLAGRDAFSLAIDRLIARMASF
jgi:hypothetical protein